MDESSTATSSSITSWPISERPRERLVAHGARRVSTVELLTILLGTGSAGRGAEKIAQDLLLLFSNRNPFQLTPEDLSKVPGIKLSKATRILAAFELGRRFLEASRPQDLPRLRSAEDVVQFVRPRLSQQSKEIFLSISVDSKNRPIHVEEVAMGSAESVAFLPRDVFRKAVSLSASGVLCVHNHPSGDPTPSEEDRKLTSRLKEAAQILGLRFLDHLIYADTGHYSFAAESI